MKRLHTVLYRVLHILLLCRKRPREITFILNHPSARAWASLVPSPCSGTVQSHPSAWFPPRLTGLFLHPQERIFSFLAKSSSDMLRDSLGGLSPWPNPSSQSRLLLTLTYRSIDAFISRARRG